MRRKLRILSGSVLFMVAGTLILDAGFAGDGIAARAEGVCVYVNPIPPYWQGGYVCTP